MKIVAIIQARLSSQRLPGKVLMDIEGKPMLLRVIDRVKESKLIEAIVIAIPYTKESEHLTGLIQSYNFNLYAGSEFDVLDRYYNAAPKYNVDPVVRITSDCPLIDPKVIDKVIQYYLDGNFDYVSNCEDYAFGLDVEVFSYESLKRAWNEAKEPYDREHVTTYIINHPDTFRIGKALYNIPENIPNAHWAVDTAKDLEFVRWVYQRLGENFRFEDVIKLMEDRDYQASRDRGYCSIV